MLFGLKDPQPRRAAAQLRSLFTQEKKFILASARPKRDQKTQGIQKYIAAIRKAIHFFFFFSLKLA